MKGGLSEQTERALESVMFLPLAFLLHSSGESLSSIVFMCRRGVSRRMGVGVADDEGNTPIKEVAGCVLRSTRTSCRDKFVSPDVQMRRILMILVFNEIITVPHTVH